jgi:acyl dehydratase
VDAEAVDLARGEGGFGGERGTSTCAAAPDLEVDMPVLPQQALLYRLCGDRNQLHSDPEFAAAARFPRRSCTACARTG